MQIRLAATALMIELIYVDENVAQEEKKRLVEILQNTWHINKEEIDTLIKLAEEKVDNANDYYHFTRLINDNYTYEMKYQLIKSLWEIAYADNELNKYEEATIRKLAELLYVEHADFIRAKQAVLSSSS